MRTFTRVALLLSVISTLVSITGCGGLASINGFYVQTKYGAPGAYSYDSGVNVDGEALKPDICTASSTCVLSFIGVTGASGLYPFDTTAVGNQKWTVGGESSTNCPGGYLSVTLLTPNSSIVPLVCSDPAVYLVSNPATFDVPDPPSGVTYTAPTAVFLSTSSAVNFTQYDDEGNQLLTGSATPSSQTTITTVPGDDVQGEHVIVFRNPETNAVLGAGEVTVVQPQTNPCSSSSTSPDVRCGP